MELTHSAMLLMFVMMNTLHYLCKQTKLLLILSLELKILILLVLEEKCLEDKYLQTTYFSSIFMKSINSNQTLQAAQLICMNFLSIIYSFNIKDVKTTSFYSTPMIAFCLVQYNYMKIQKVLYVLIAFPLVQSAMGLSLLIV